MKDIDTKTIVFKVAGKEYQIITPFSFRFWKWLFEMILPEGNEKPETIVNSMINAIAQNINAIQSKLIGITEQEIEDNQLEEEMMEALTNFSNEFKEESNLNPFSKARTQVMLSKIRISKEQIQKFQEKNGSGK